ncbi:MAG: hypothetical protein HZB46_10375, partial [Solirubrobacterales bacterium]|nr:hypothetical protein [Solirubrobacterales bacterium]
MRSTVAGLLGLIGLAAAPAGAQEGLTAPTTCTFGTFGAGAWPGACWRPYAEDSPFNRPLPAEPRLARGSAAI